MSTSRWLGWLASPISVAVVTIGAEASAAPAVTFEDCQPALRDELRQLMAVELAASPSTEVRARKLHIRCLGARAEVTVTWQGNHDAKREVDLHDVAPPARARVLAISATEVVRAGPPRAPALDVSTPSRPLGPTTAPARSFALALGPNVLWFVGGPGPFLGGTLFSRVDLIASGALELSASVSGAEQKLSGGRASLLLGHVFVGGAWRVVREWPELALFGGLRLGWVRGRGEPNDPAFFQARSISLPWAGPELGADVRWWHAWLAAGLRVEAGYTLASAYGRVDSAREVALRGAFVSLSLVVGLGS